MARRGWSDRGAVLVILAAVLLLHPLGPILRNPYWLDEEWVALSSKVSLSHLPVTTGSSPIGWTFLIWLLPPYGQVHRLVAFAFLVCATLAAYALARLLPWPSRTLSILAGLVAAAAVLLVPATPLRQDLLKQYTADAAVTLVLLVLLCRAETVWSRRRAAALAAAMLLAVPLTHSAAFTDAAVLGGLGVTALVHRAWRRLAALAGLLVVIAGIAVLVYLLLERTGRNSAIYAYWQAYLPTLPHVPVYLPRRLHHLEPLIGMAWPAFVLLAVAGVATIARLGRPSLAICLGLLPVEAVVAGVTGQYPLLDGRTSHFLLVTGAVLAGIGTVGTIVTLTRLRAGRAVPVAVALVVVAVSGYAVVNRGTWLHPAPPGMPSEDIRAQVRYMAAHRRPGDVVLTNAVGQYGLAYYWSPGSFHIARGGDLTTGWIVRYPPSSRVVVAGGPDPGAIQQAWQDAVALAGRPGRIWLIRTHTFAPEWHNWDQVLARYHTQTVPVGPEPLVLASTG